MSNVLQAIQACDTSHSLSQSPQYTFGAPSQHPKVPEKFVCSPLARMQINNARYKYVLYIYSLFLTGIQTGKIF